MFIKDHEGNQHNVASNGKANAGLGLGIAGTALGILNGGANMFGWGRNNYNNGYETCHYHTGYANGACEPGARYITKDEAILMQQLQDKDIVIARKDSDLALQKSENYTDKKIVDATTYLDGKINRLADKVDNNLHEQMLINAKQGEWNAAATGTMSSLATQIAALQSITKLFVPEGNVCRQSCSCCGNCAA